MHELIAQVSFPVVFETADFTMHHFGRWAERFKPSRKYGAVQGVVICLERDELERLLDETGLHLQLLDTQRFRLTRDRGGLRPVAHVILPD